MTNLIPQIRSVSIAANETIATVAYLDIDHADGFPLLVETRELRWPGAIGHRDVALRVFGRAPA